MILLLIGYCAGGVWWYEIVALTNLNLLIRWICGKSEMRYYILKVTKDFLYNIWTAVI